MFFQIIFITFFINANANPVNSTSNKIEYNDEVARNKMFPLASAAYSSNPQICLNNRFSNAQVKRQINVNCDSFRDDICSGYTALLNDDQAIVISFRGTQGFLQLLEEADQSVFTSQTDWAAGGKVSTYFADAFNFLWFSGIRDDVIAFIHQYPNYDVYVTGHSLGGSLASLAASYLVSNGIQTSDRVKLVTFGQPRTGNKDWAVAHDQQVQYSFRLTHNRDIVPHIPNEGYMGYYQHKTEVWYREGMNYGDSFTICTTDDESNNCSDGLWFTTSISDHTHYFEQDVSSWGEAGCN